jgi:hypothetical protein
MRGGSSEPRSWPGISHAAAGPPVFHNYCKKVVLRTFEILSILTETRLSTPLPPYRTGREAPSGSSPQGPCSGAFSFGPTGALPDPLSGLARPSEKDRPFSHPKPRASAFGKSLRKAGGRALPPRDSPAVIGAQRPLRQQSCQSLPPHPRLARCVAPHPVPHSPQPPRKACGGIRYSCRIRRELF